ncbi:MAG: ATP-binding cassette domain-containing protein, partial [Acidimicrobiales bacterium]
MDKAGTAGGAVIAARDLSAGYGGSTIWSGADFEVHPGEFVAVLGPNGSGKSTLLKMILGVVPAEGGSLEVLGEPPKRGNPLIGYLPQQRPIDPEVALRGVDVVRLGVDGHRWGFPLPGASRAAAQRRVDALIERIGAEGYARR